MILFTPANMVLVQVLASASDLKTVVRVVYAYDHSAEAVTAAIRFSAPEAIKEYGEVDMEIRALWIREARQAYALGERLIRRLARPLWSVIFETGIDYADLSPGDDIVLSHPYLPIEEPVTVTILDCEVDYGAAVVRITTEIPAGAAPKIVMETLSTAM